jgi:hypothetical protein
MHTVYNSRAVLSTGVTSVTFVKKPGIGRLLLPPTNPGNPTLASLLCTLTLSGRDFLHYLGTLYHL